MNGTEAAATSSSSPRYLVFGSSSSGGVSTSNGANGFDELEPQAVLAPCTVSFLSPSTNGLTKPSPTSTPPRNVVLQRTLDANPDGHAAVLYHWVSLDALKPLSVDSPTHALQSDAFVLGGLALRLHLYRRSIKNGAAEAGGAPPTGLTVALTADNMDRREVHVDPLSDLWERRISFELDVFTPQSAIEVAEFVRRPNDGYGVLPPNARRGLGTGRFLREVTMGPSHKSTLVDPLVPFKDLTAALWPGTAWRDFVDSVINYVPETIIPGCAPHSGCDDKSHFASPDYPLFKGSLVVLRLCVNVRRDPKALRLAHGALSLRSRRRVGHVGMQNPGSVCFCNALCQLMYHNTICRRVILDAPVPERGTSASLQLQRVFYMLETSSTPASPSALFEALQLSMDAQQDAHEFLLKVFFNFALKPIKEMLQIGMRFVVRCTNVKFDVKGAREDHFDLSVGPNGQGLVAAINKELADEPLSDLYDTQQPELGKQPATRQLTLESLPPLLFVHVRRFDRQLTKMHGSMPLPLSFALCHCAAGRDADALHEKHSIDRSLISTYVLQSAVLHHGQGIASGHYTAMCRSTAGPGAPADDMYGLDDDDMPTRFLHFDDDAVYPVATTEALRRMSGMYWLSPSSSAYIVLYVRRDVAPQSTHDAAAAPAVLRNALVREGLIKPPRGSVDGADDTLDASTSAEVKAVVSPITPPTEPSAATRGMVVRRKNTPLSNGAPTMGNARPTSGDTAFVDLAAEDDMPESLMRSNTGGGGQFSRDSEQIGAMDPLTMPPRHSSSSTSTLPPQPPPREPPTPANRILSGIDLVSSENEEDLDGAEGSMSHHGSFASPAALIAIPSPRRSPAPGDGVGTPSGATTGASSPPKSPQQEAFGAAGFPRAQQDLTSSTGPNRSVVGPAWGMAAFVRCTFFTLSDMSRIERLLPGAQADLVPCGGPSVFNAQSANSRANMLGFTAAVRGDVSMAKLKKQALMSVPSVQRDCRTTPLGEAATISPADIPGHLRNIRLWLFVPRANGTFRPSIELSETCYCTPARPGESDAAVFALEAELLKQVPPSSTDRPTRPRLVADAVFLLAACNALPTDDYVPAISIYVEVMGLQQLPRLLLPRSLQYLTPTASPNASRDQTPNYRSALGDEPYVLLFVRVCLITMRKAQASPSESLTDVELASSPESIQPGLVGTVYVPMRDSILQLKTLIMQKQRGVCGDNPGEFILTEVVRPHRVDVLDDKLTIAESNLGHGDIVMLVSRVVRTPINSIPMPERLLEPAKALVLASEAVRRGSNIQYVVVRIIDDSGLSSRIRIRTNGNFHPFAMRRRPLGRDPHTGQLRDSSPFIIALDLERDTLTTVAEKVRNELDKRVKSLITPLSDGQGADEASLRATTRLANASNLFSIRLWAAARILTKQHGASDPEFTSLPAIPVTEAMMDVKLDRMERWFKQKSDEEIHKAVEQLRDPASEFTPATFFWSGSPVAAFLQWDHPTLYDDEVDGAADIKEMHLVGGDVPKDSFHGKDMDHVLAHANGTAYRSQRGRRTSEAERSFNANTAIPFPDLPVSYVLPIFAEVTSREAVLSPLPDFPVAVSWLGDTPGEPLQILKFPKFPGSGTVALLMHLCALQLGLISAGLKPSDSCPCACWTLTVVRGSTIDHIVQSCCILTPFPSDEQQPQHAQAHAHPAGANGNGSSESTPHALDRIRSGPSASLSKLLFFDGGATHRQGDDAVVQIQECREGAVMISVSFVETATGLYRGTPFLIELPRTLGELRRSVFNVVATDHSPLTLAAELTKPGQADAPPNVIRLSSDKDFADMLTKLQRKSRAAPQRPVPAQAGTGARAIDMPHVQGNVVWLAPEWDLSRYLVFY